MLAMTSEMLRLVVLGLFWGEGACFVRLAAYSTCALLFSRCDRTLVLKGGVLHFSLQREISGGKAGAIFPGTPVHFFHEIYGVLGRPVCHLSQQVEKAHDA